MKTLYIAIVSAMMLFSCSGDKGSSGSGNVDLNKDSLVLLNNGWMVYNCEDDNAEFNCQGEEITLPHTWNKTDVVDQVPGYRRDKSSYIRTLKLNKVQEGISYYLYFEGSNITTRVYVNDKEAGSHVGGYVGFEIDITAQLKDGDNKIRIDVDNEVNREIIPSQKSDFFIYGGITRDLWLGMRPQSVMKDFTPQITHLGENKFKVTATLDSEPGQLLVLELMDGKKSLAKSAATNDGAIEVDVPELWSPDNPKLYTLNCYEINGDTKVYEASKQVGFRYYEFRERGAFYLNGKKLLIRGTHRHEEHAGVGAAMSNEMHYKNIADIKNMGANFVRLAHYPQDPEVYKACNELGVLVWDELPWCRGGVGNNVWKEHTKRLLTEQIKQNVHHPSIIMWSVGNEMYWDEDFEGGGEIEKVREHVGTLSNLARKLDPTRPTCLRKFYEGVDLVDVFSPSIWAGWYRGKMGEYENALKDANEKYPRFVHMEYGAASHVGRHDEKELAIGIDAGWEEDPTKVGISNMSSKGTWSETYAVDLFDWHLYVSEHQENFTGNAQWAFKDFGTPLRPENPIPYINQKGLVDREGRPKDAYYVFRSYWDTKEKFAYIQSHTWTTRYGAEGEMKKIRVYSNCVEVELFLNGESLGSKTRDIDKFPAQGLVWDVKFKEGDNVLEAKSADASDKVELEYITKEPGKAREIELEIISQDDDETIVEAKVVDKEGLLVPDYREYLYFTMDGQGQLLGNLGTPDGSLIIEPMTGKARIKVNGKGMVEVRNQDFKGSYIRVE